LERKYKTDVERLDQDYTGKIGHLESERQRWGKEHEEALKRLEEAKTRTEEESRVVREAFQRKDEEIQKHLHDREKEFDEYKKTVETEWPARFEARVAEVADRTRRHLAEKEAEFAEAKKHWVEETADARLKITTRMNELEASFAQKDEELNRRFLQKQHELTVQTEKAMSDLHARQLALEKQRGEFERLSDETAKRKEELEEAKRDLQKRLESVTQEFVHQQSIMDEQMRRLQNEKHELKISMENMAQKVRGAIVNKPTVHPTVQPSVQPMAPQAVEPPDTNDQPGNEQQAA